MEYGLAPSNPCLSSSKACLGVVFPVKPADGSTPEELLRKRVFENAGKLYGPLSSEIKGRIERELGVIESKGFAGYFLINWDLCKWAHEKNIPVGARGSAVGTIVGYYSTN